MPILDQITRGLEEVTKIVETLIKVSKSVQKETYDSTEEGNIQVIMENNRFSYTDAHARGFTKSVK